MWSAKSNKTSRWRKLRNLWVCVLGLQLYYICVWTDRLRQNFHYGGIQVQFQRKRSSYCFDWIRRNGGHRTKVNQTNFWLNEARVEPRQEKIHSVLQLPSSLQRKNIRSTKQESYKTSFNRRAWLETEISKRHILSREPLYFWVSVSGGCARSLPFRP